MHRLSPVKWLTTVALIALTSISGLMLFARHADPFGLFTFDAHRPVYGNERLSKYLLARHYVPENFSGLLIGTSMTLNWNIELDQYKVYNMSISGGNYPEAELLTQTVYSGKRYPRLAIVTLSPYMAQETYPKSKFMGDSVVSVASGSLEFFRAMLGKLIDYSLYDHNGVALKFSFGPPLKAFPDGDSTPLYEVNSAVLNTNPSSVRKSDPFNTEFPGFENLERIYKILDSHGVCVISVIPPVAPSGFPAEDFAKSDRFYMVATRLASRYGRIISGNDDSFREFRLQPSNFSDLVHPSRTGAPVLSRKMSRLIAGAAEDTALPQHCELAFDYRLKLTDLLGQS